MILEFYDAKIKIPPFSIGWHSYFRLGCPVDELLLSIPASRFIEVDRALIPTGSFPEVYGSGYDFVKPGVIGNLILDTGFLNLDGDTELITGGLKIVFRQDGELFSCLQAFITPDRKSIALEPVSAGPDSFNMSSLNVSLQGNLSEKNYVFSMKEIIQFQ